MNFTPLDKVLVEMQHGLSVLAGVASVQRPLEVRLGGEDELTHAQRRESAALMRVNHVGEVCAQALYRGQRAAAAEQHLRQEFEGAAREEVDHLGWTADRIEQLGGRTSLLNPFWYAGSFALGFLAGKIGNAHSLGFMAETEAQVERHLDSHLSKLPGNDHRSRHIVERMKEDEARHGQRAVALGAASLPLPVKLAMKGMAKFMTTTSYVI